MRNQSTILMVALSLLLALTCSDNSGPECPKGFHTDDRFGRCQDACTGVDCGYGGRCVPLSESEQKCECDPGSELYNGRCERACVAGETRTDHGCVNPCNSNPCGNHGDCEPIDAIQYNCHCDEGYFNSGDGCHSPCDRDPCGLHGTCRAISAFNYECLCQPGFVEGEDGCELECLTDRCNPEEICVGYECVEACPLGCPENYLCDSDTRRCLNPCEWDLACDRQEACHWDGVQELCAAEGMGIRDSLTLEFRPDLGREIRGQEPGFWSRSYDDDLPRPDSFLRLVLSHHLVIRLPLDRDSNAVAPVFRWDGGEAKGGLWSLDDSQWSRSGYLSLQSFIWDESLDSWVLLFLLGDSLMQWGLLLNNVRIEIWGYSDGQTQAASYRARMSGFACTENRLGLEAILNYWEIADLLCLEFDFYDIPAYPVE